MLRIQIAWDDILTSPVNSSVALGIIFPGPQLRFIFKIIRMPSSLGCYQDTIKNKIEECLL